jgi:hypothetical protein
MPTFRPSSFFAAIVSCCALGAFASRPPKWISNILQDDACRPKAPSSLKRYGKILPIQNIRHAVVVG